MKLKIKEKLTVGFGGTLLIVLIIGMISIFKLYSIETAQNEVRYDQYPSVKTLQEIKFDLSEIRRISYQIASADDETKGVFQKEIDETIDKINNDLKDYSAFLSTDEEKEFYEKCKEEIEDYLNDTRQALEEDDEDKIEMILAESYECYKQVTQLLNSGAEMNMVYIEDAFSTADKLMKTTRMQLLFAFIGMVIFSAICGLIISKNIISSTSKILHGINKVADGDLTEKIEVTTKDEMGIISESTNNLIDSLGSMINNIMNIAEQVAASSEELSATCEETNASNEEVAETVNELAAGAAEQNEAVLESSKIIDRMSENIKSVAETSHMVTRSSDNVLNMSNSGLEQINNAIEKIKNVENSTNEVAEVIKTLGEQSKQIGEIVEVIKSLSEQTNLLSLNAAIEAARAGEQGKGFAVVAEQVKKLAEESSLSAESIAKLIKTIQDETSIAVEAIKKGTNDVSIGVEAVSVSGHTFKNIYDEITAVVNQIKEVDILSSEAIKCSNDVVNAIDRISRIAENAASRSEEVAASAEEQNASMESVVKASETLAELGNELQNSISIFKV